MLLDRLNLTLRQGDPWCGRSPKPGQTLEECSSLSPEAVYQEAVRTLLRIAFLQLAGSPLSPDQLSWQGLQHRQAIIAGCHTRRRDNTSAPLFAIKPAGCFHHLPFSDAESAELCRLLGPRDDRQDAALLLGSLVEESLAFSIQCASSSHDASAAAYELCASDARGASGSHYTPADLTAEVLQHAIQAYEAGQPHEAGPHRELPLVGDIACGGGAFLVEACRQLADRLMEHHELSELAARRIAARQLFGVDRNPLAVEAARLAVWLCVGDPRLPLDYFADNIGCGDSLLGDAFTRSASPPALPDRPRFDWPEVFPSIAARGGFDLIVGNPPFLGGRKIRSTLGRDYLDWLTSDLCPGASGNADLCAFFFRRSAELLRPGGVLGLVATNTISQGDTRETGLAPMLREGSIFRAETQRTWPGSATVQVSLVWYRRESKSPATASTDDQPAMLDGRPARRISSFLTTGDFEQKPDRLVENLELSYQGSIVLGLGFVLTHDQASDLIGRNPRNAQALRPYLTGENLNKHPQQAPGRWVINFFDWPLDHATAPEDYQGPVAADFPDLLSIVETKVRPQRTRLRPNGDYVLRRPLPQRWWIYADKRPQLYSRIAGLPRVLCKTRHSPHWAFEFVQPGVVFQESLAVFASDDIGLWGALSSGLHEVWSRQLGSTLGEGLRYSATDCFDTFALPPLEPIRSAASALHQARRAMLDANQVGLSQVCRRLHSESDNREDICQLRQLYVDLDQAVAAAYGWSDLNVERALDATGFHLAAETQTEILRRLFALNQERAAKGKRGR
ncbi:Eco57I restriction-modification methylase domain-containing protein [Lignipirellula cremea]|uniref:site-specific DNA-methyltransferase (adenine-specific) n=1 Tax=Lignipirellula cremea TaxID=2528010 RepID=A0A518E0M3_9BACT|nr:DNA methyltransferase [Lignipirellula cremea]QDU97611.1 hypothetical protein Pla8534_54610 [Lignipirellula cremea]